MQTERHPASAAADRIFKKHLVTLTLGGEPTLIPEKPEGAEWSVSAVGPTKLAYGYNFAAEVAKHLPGPLTLFSPGKLYPGEVNPRWALHLFWRRDGRPLLDPAQEPKKRPVTPPILEKLRKAVVRGLGLRDQWLKANDGSNKRNQVWVLPLDFEEDHWRTGRWTKPGVDEIDLIGAEGPAGLRLPLGMIPAKALRRALVFECTAGTLRIFMPPLLHAPFEALVEMLVKEMRATEIGGTDFQGYLPPDSGKVWNRLGVAADPGVLEINLPPCETWEIYADWLQLLEDCAEPVGLRSYKTATIGGEQGTGGGNHLLFGGADLEDHPFFTRPAWLASILRYMQRHPSFAYCFTGIYVGSSSQAPRPDESGTSLWDLEMAYDFLATLPKGDHRYLIGETLRHLHTDTSGNTHRCETSFDKFWSPNAPNGCLGLVEFRAIESMPNAGWMSAVALLWRCVAAMTLENPVPGPLVRLGMQLQDQYFLPSYLWDDLRVVMDELEAAGMPLDRGLYRAIWDWRFPVLLEEEIGGATLTVRRGCEGWPLLCETPTEGGSTSRFVDTSMERLEFLIEGKKTAFRIFVNDREMPVQVMPGGAVGGGLRYRRTALYPSLHPGIPTQLPLRVVLEPRNSGKPRAFIIADTDGRMLPAKVSRAKKSGTPLRGHDEQGLTFDLRLP